MRISCGVIVTDGKSLLLGHATRSPRWDIPKGLVEPGEAALTAGIRELQEETGLAAQPQDLADLGTHAYLHDKMLALLGWKVTVMPDPGALRCDSTFTVGGEVLPEFDRFGVFAWDDALLRVGKNLARVLDALRQSPAWSDFFAASDRAESRRD